ncbi:pentatricopeptide repeat-containing protein At2g34400-like [Solanum tuberosum]|uniref:pentatricopeptide repeat-containing protein At2g34400-like n=1 Tax=Solanum tuberosum TaxID=4113 RepID=UPI00073A5357|nr:PREDICTED: pentatricopeptide repeat-containing protein At2g34400-like [Solanum tuberosum]
MIRAYSQIKSLKLFKQFQKIGLKPDKFTCPVALKVCGHCLMIGTGGSLHSMAVKSGFGSDLHVNNTLLRMYTGFGVIRLERLVFDEMLQRDIVSWSSMMATYVHCNLPSDALLLFQCMKLANEKPNSVTLVKSFCYHQSDPLHLSLFFLYLLPNSVLHFYY